MSENICTNAHEGVNVQALDFLWLELTNQCNLQCVHCYSESAPHTTEKNLLDEPRYEAIISDAHRLGCRHIQFIGGEPTLNRSLPKLIAHADDCGYDLIEVYSNLINLSSSLLGVFVKHRVAVATSVYAHDPELHDLITRSSGSHARTIRNIKRVLDSGLSLRVGVISMKENKAAIDATFAFLRDMGVTDIGLDHVRSFGRAQSQSACSMENLCGNCAHNLLAIGPDGVVAPCIMSKNWAVGSILNTSLKEIAMSDRLFRTRRDIAQATTRKSGWPGGPDPCHPDRSCMPNCAPSSNCTPCSPNAGQPCRPNRWCDPSK